MTSSPAKLLIIACGKGRGFQATGTVVYCICMYSRPSDLATSNSKTLQNSHYPLLTPVRQCTVLTAATANDYNYHFININEKTSSCLSFRHTDALSL